MENKKPFDVKSFIKSEGLTGARLKSLGLPRDLNLSGAIKSTKKVYTPNLNVVRNKDKKREIIRTKIEEAKKQRQLKGKAKQEHQPQQISHTAGIFSEGFQSTLGTAASTSSARQSAGRDVDTGPVMNVPKINKGSWAKVNHSEEASVVDKLLHIYSSDSESDEDQNMAPVTLEFNVKEVIKTEQDHQNVGQGNDKNANFLFTHSSNRAGFFDANLDDENPHLYLLKMPESLSGKYFAETSDDKNTDYRMLDMHEGQVGKLLIRKSGKMEMQIGNIKYDLRDDPEAPISQDVICMPEHSREPSFARLQNIKERLLMVPNWNLLMAAKPTYL